MRAILLKTGTILTLSCLTNIAIAQNRNVSFDITNYGNEQPQQNNTSRNVSRNVSRNNINQVQVQQVQSNVAPYTLNNGPNTNINNLNNRNVNVNFLNNDNNVQTNVNSYNNSNLNNSFQALALDNNTNANPSRNTNKTNSNSREQTIASRGNRGNEIIIQQKVETKQIQINESNSDQADVAVSNTDAERSNNQRSINIELPKITAPKIVISTTPKPAATKEVKTSTATVKAEKVTSTNNSSTSSSSKSTKSAKKVKQHKFKKKVLKPAGSWFKRTFKKKTHKGVFSVKCFSFNS
jgi:hypothetical protein